MLYSVQKLRAMSTQPSSSFIDSALAHSEALPAGTRLAEFEIQSLLGVGGFGMVYRAYDHSLHRPVAIKEYMPSSLAGRQAGNTVVIRSSGDQPAYQTGLTSFVAEARLLAQFDHPSLVKVFRFWESNNTAYMAMPLYAGMTLKQARQLMAAPPPEPWLRTVMWSILQALRVLHDNHTMHRDVTPDNIFLQDQGPPVLLDLGAARRAITDKTHKHTAILKVNFAPIEQYAEADDLFQGPWTDLYSLAAVVHYCLRNEPPLPATSRVVRDSLPKLPAIAQTLAVHFGRHYSEELQLTLTHALAIQPQDRPQTVQAFIDQMQLEQPRDLPEFDWRDKLGEPLLQPQERASNIEYATQRLDTLPGQAVTQFPTENLDLDLSDVIRQATRPRSQTAVSRPTESRSKRAARVRTPLAWLGLVLLVLVSMGLWVFKLTVPFEPVAVTSPPALSLTPEPEPGSKTTPVRKNALAAAKKTAQTPTDPSSVKYWARPSQELCADSNFFGKPLCIHEECKKPENARLAVCIEDHQKYPAGGRPLPSP